MTMNNTEIKCQIALNIVKYLTENTECEVSKESWSSYPVFSILNDSILVGICNEDDLKGNDEYDTQKYFYITDNDTQKFYEYDDLLLFTIKLFELINQK